MEVGKDWLFINTEARNVLHHLRSPIDDFKWSHFSIIGLQAYLRIGLWNMAFYGFVVREDGKLMD